MTPPGGEEGSGAFEQISQARILGLPAVPVVIGVTVLGLVAVVVL